VRVHAHRNALRVAEAAHTVAGIPAVEKKRRARLAPGTQQLAGAASAQQTTSEFARYVLGEEPISRDFVSLLRTALDVMVHGPERRAAARDMPDVTKLRVSPSYILDLSLTVSTDPALSKSETWL
jgi:hypothetical protein